MSVSRIFSELYEKKTWGDGVDVPLSGGGSDPEVARPYVDFVKNAINDHSINSVVDVGHGDWTMWRDFQFPNILYMGFDAVESLSQRNNALYGSENVIFSYADATESDLPNADLFISKEALQHLSNQNIEKILNKLDRYKYLILSNAIHLPKMSSRVKFLPSRLAIRSRLKAIRSKRNPFFIVSRKNNIDIHDGEWRPLDLQKEPFGKYFQDWILIKLLIYPGSNYRGVAQAIYFFRKR